MLRVLKTFRTERGETYRIGDEVKPDAFSPGRPAIPGKPAVEAKAATATSLATPAVDAIPGRPEDLGELETLKAGGFLEDDSTAPAAPSSHSQPGRVAAVPQLAGAKPA